MTYFHDTTANVNYLASIMPMPKVVAKAWLRSEGQTINNPTNPLNILYYGSAGQIGKRGRFAVYASAAAGLQGAARLIHNLTYYKGVRAAIARWEDTGSRASIVGIARAIEDSPYAAGHYGGGGAADGIITRYVLSHLPITLPPTPTTGRAYIATWTEVWKVTDTTHEMVGGIHGGGAIVPIGNMVKLDGLHWWPITQGEWRGKYLHTGESSFVVHQP